MGKIYRHNAKLLTIGQNQSQSSLNSLPFFSVQALTHRIKSTHLDNTRTLWVYPPRKGTQARSLVVLLDGEFYREKMHAPKIVDSLAGTLAEAWYVYVSMHSLKVRARECACHPPFAAFIVDELLPFLAEQHPALAEVKHRVLVGLSFSALAAPHIIKEYPGAFQAAICQSASLWWNDSFLIKDYARLTSALPTRFHLDVGREETDVDGPHVKEEDPAMIQTVSQVEGTRQLRDILLTHGHDVNYVEFDGGHDFAGWSSTLPSALQWALPLAPQKP